MQSKKRSTTCIGIASVVRANPCGINDIQRMTAERSVGTHARTQGLVKGKLVVPDDLPKHLKQSMFEHGGEYPVVCRYSSEPGDPGLDVRSFQTAE